MKIKKYITSTAAILLSFSLTACGSASADKSWASDSAYVTTESVALNSSAATAPGWSMNGGIYTDGIYDDYKEEYDYDDPAEPALPEASSGLENRKLIKTVNMRVETLEFDEFIKGLESEINSAGGYIQNSGIDNASYYYTQHGYKYSRYASYTVRIPSLHLDGFVNRLGVLGNVTSKNISTTDVTLGYIDTEARAETLKLQQERLLALLEKAEDIDSIISLEARLSDVTYQLESSKKQLRNYDNLVEFSTINLEINEVERQTITEELSYGEQILAGLSDTFYSISEGFKSFVMWFIVTLPFLLIWAVIIAIIIFILVKVLRRSKKRKATAVKAEKKAEAPAEKQNTGEEDK